MGTEVFKPPQKNRKILVAVCMFGLLGILFGLLLLIPLSVDYIHYSTSTRAFLRGDSHLYDAGTNSYYYMPWGLLVTAPLSLLPDHWGQAIISLICIIGIVISIILLSGRVPGWIYILVVVNLYTVNMVFSGQWDGISVGACALAWWSALHRRPHALGIGILLSTIKPTDTILFTILLGIYVWLNWPKDKILITFAWLATTFMASLILCGVDWPVRYVSYLKAFPPPSQYNLSLWKEFSWLAIVPLILIEGWFILLLKRRGIDSFSLSSALLVNLLISPYTLSYHFVVASPVLGWVSKRLGYLALVPWVITLYSLVSVAYSFQWPGFLLYPLSIWFLSVFISSRGLATS